MGKKISYSGMGTDGAQAGDQNSRGRFVEKLYPSGLSVSWPEEDNLLLDRLTISDPIKAGELTRVRRELEKVYTEMAGVATFDGKIDLADPAITDDMKQNQSDLMEQLVNIYYDVIPDRENIASQIGKSCEALSEIGQRQTKPETHSRN